MADSDNDSPEGPTGGSAPSARPPAQAPIGGIVRDPRDAKTNPTLFRFFRERMSAALVSGLVLIGVAATAHRRRRARPAQVEGPLGVPRHDLAIVFVWTSVHVVQPGNVAVPVTFGHSGKPLKPGLHITLPFTAAYSLSTRTQNYTMSSLKGEGGNTDDSVAVLGKDGGQQRQRETDGVAALTLEGRHGVVLGARRQRYAGVNGNVMCKPGLSSCPNART